MNFLPMVTLCWPELGRHPFIKQVCVWCISDVW
jgi:hypothetical protein